MRNVIILLVNKDIFIPTEKWHGALTLNCNSAFVPINTEWYKITWNESVLGLLESDLALESCIGTKNILFEVWNY